MATQGFFKGQQRFFLAVAVYAVTLSPVFGWAKSGEFVSPGRQVSKSVKMFDLDGDRVEDAKLIRIKGGYQLQGPVSRDGMPRWVQVKSGQITLEYTQLANRQYQKLKVINRERASIVEGIFYLSRDRSRYDLWRATRRPYVDLFFGDSEEPSATFAGESNWESFEAIEETDVTTPELRSASNASSASIPASVQSEVPSRDLREGGACSLREGPFLTDGNQSLFAAELESASISSDPIAAKLIDRSCVPHSGAIIDAINSVFKDTTRSAAPTYVSCLARFSQYEMKLGEILAELSSRLSSSSSQPLVTCHTDFPSGRQAKFVTSSRQVQLNSQWLKQGVKTSDIKQAIFHEIVHSADIEDESLTNAVVNCCSAGFSTKKPACTTVAESPEGPTDNVPINPLFENSEFGEILLAVDSEDPQRRIALEASMVSALETAAALPECSVERGSDVAACRSRLNDVLSPMVSSALSACHGALNAADCQAIKVEAEHWLSIRLGSCSRAGRARACTANALINGDESLPNPATAGEVEAARGTKPAETTRARPDSSGGVAVPVVMTPHVPATTEVLIDASVDATRSVADWISREIVPNARADAAPGANGHVGASSAPQVAQTTQPSAMASGSSASSRSSGLDTSASRSTGGRAVRPLACRGVSGTNGSSGNGHKQTASAASLQGRVPLIPRAKDGAPVQVGLSFPNLTRAQAGRSSSGANRLDSSHENAIGEASGATSLAAGDARAKRPQPSTVRNGSAGAAAKGPSRAVAAPGAAASGPGIRGLSSASSARGFRRGASSAAGDGAGADSAPSDNNVTYAQVNDVNGLAALLKTSSSPMDLIRQKDFEILLNRIGVQLVYRNEPIGPLNPSRGRYNLCMFIDCRGTR